MDNSKAIHRPNIRHLFHRLGASISGNKTQETVVEESTTKSTADPEPVAPLQQKITNMRVSTTKPREGELSLERKTPIPSLDEITLLNQTASPFLRLPGEIRNRIYTYALGGQHIYAMTGGYRKGYVLMGKPHDTLPWKLYPISHILATNLPGVCRQTYFETNLLLFELNSFGTVLLDGFVPLVNGFSKAQRRIVEEVRLPVFEHFVEDKVPVKEFPGLKRVVLRSFSRVSKERIVGRARMWKGWEGLEVEVEYV